MPFTLCAFFCTDWFHCRRTHDIAMRENQLRLFVLLPLYMHPENTFIPLADWLAECLSIDSLHNDLFVAIMYHQALYFFVALFLYLSLYPLHIAFTLSRAVVALNSLCTSKPHPLTLNTHHLMNAIIIRLNNRN